MNKNRILVHYKLFDIGGYFEISLFKISRVDCMFPTSTQMWHCYKVRHQDKLVISPGLPDCLSFESLQ